MERLPRESRDSSLDPRRRKRKASEDARGDRKRIRIEERKSLIEIEKIEERKKIEEREKKYIIWSKYIISSRVNENFKEILYILGTNEVPRDDRKKVDNLLKSFCNLLPISEANVDQLAEYAHQSEQWRDDFREKYPVPASQASERIERERFVENSKKRERKYIIWSRFNDNIKEILHIIHTNEVPRDDHKEVDNLLISFCNLLPISEANVDQLAEYARQSEQWHDDFRKKYPVPASQASERIEHSIEKSEESKRKDIILSSFKANIKEILDIIHPKFFTVQRARDDHEKVNNLLISFYNLLPISEANVYQLAEYARQSEQWRDDFRKKYRELEIKSEMAEKSKERIERNNKELKERIVNLTKLRENILEEYPRLRDILFSIRMLNRFILEALHKIDTELFKKEIIDYNCNKGKCNRIIVKYNIKRYKLLNVIRGHETNIHKHNLRYGELGEKLKVEDFDISNMPHYLDLLPNHLTFESIEKLLENPDYKKLPLAAEKMAEKSKERIERNNKKLKERIVNLTKLKKNTLEGDELRDNLLFTITLNKSISRIELREIDTKLFEKEIIDYNSTKDRCNQVIVEYNTERDKLLDTIRDHEKNIHKHNLRYGELGEKLKVEDFDTSNMPHNLDLLPDDLKLASLIKLLENPEYKKLAAEEDFEDDDEEDDEEASESDH